MNSEKKDSKKEWSSSNTDVFWAEIAPCNHLLQIYDSDEIIIDSLQGFVSSGLNSGESVIIIATDEHLKSLNKVLINQGYNLDLLIKSDLYIPLNAEVALNNFMVNNWPDDVLFNEFVKSVVVRAHGDTNRKVRAYGEMVALLWAKGLNGATVYLEHLWNEFCSTESFCLFCAYPKTGFTQDVKSSINHICSAHTKILAGDKITPSQVLYKNT